MIGVINKKAPGPAAGAKGKPAAAGAAKKQAAPPAKKWTPQDEAARKIQRHIRRFLAQRKLIKLKKEKQDYDDLMDRLEKEVLLLVFFFI